MIAGVGCSLCVAAADAQWRGRYREGSFAARYAPPRMPDGDFTVCRLEYTRVVIEDMGVGWQTDYPFSERNLMTRLSELTKTPISRDERNEPNSWVVRATDPQLFNCPYVVASDAGTIGLKSAEGYSGLRDYLLKGGFLWVDDFWGTAAWEQWSSEIGRVLPPTEFPITDVPLTDPLLRSCVHGHDRFRRLRTSNSGAARRAGSRPSAARTASSPICAPFAIVTAASWC